MLNSVSPQIRIEALSYLNEHYAEVDDEILGLYRFWHRALTDLGDDLPANGAALELGTGPALYSAFPLAERFVRIDLADYCPEAFDLIRDWRDAVPGAFDRSAFARLALAVEAGVADVTRVPASAVHARQERLRGAIGDLLYCNLLTPEVLPGAPGDRYDLVTAHFCTEVPAATLEEWQAVVSAIAGLARPGGLVMISVSKDLRRVPRFFDNPETRPALPISVEAAREVVSRLGVAGGPVRVAFNPVAQPRTYSGGVLIAFRTPGHLTATANR